MRGLELNYGVTKECITNIQHLSALYPAATRPVVSGQGQVIDKIEQMADLYVFFYLAWEKLAEETANYLDNMITDFQAADKQKTGNPGAAGIK